MLSAKADDYCLHRTGMAAVARIRICRGVGRSDVTHAGKVARAAGGGVDLGPGER
jgi:hypothetical protein